jgi:hypothetical protein
MRISTLVHTYFYALKLRTSTHEDCVEILLTRSWRILIFVTHIRAKMISKTNKQHSTPIKKGYSSAHSESFCRNLSFQETFQLFISSPFGNKDQ